LNFKVTVPVILSLLLTVFSLVSGGQSESYIKKGQYILPSYSEEWQLNRSPGKTNQEEAFISINTEAAMSSFAFLAVKLSESHPSLQLTGIIQARSLIHAGFDISLICRYSKAGKSKYLKAVIRHNIYDEISLEKLLLNLDYKP